MRTLDAWLEGQLVGRFTRDADRRVIFEYASADAPVISASLPRDGSWTKQAPVNFLDNLLPDRPQTRERIASTLRAESADTFDLLDKVGSDVAGGLVLVPGGHAPHSVAEPLRPATDDEIAYRIDQLGRDGDNWVDPEVKPRFSLAGSQAKFALADVGGRWFWSSASLPSTHILKPESASTPHAQVIEVASMRLSALVGIETPHADTIEVFDQSSYIVERFDRDRSGRVAQRIHMEDFAQASGSAPGAKYGMQPQQAVELLRRIDPTEALAYEFIERLAFNTSIANADAHAKNYSLMIRPDGFSLAPMYDAIVTTFWSHVDERLAMKIGGADRSAQITGHHWAKMARTAGLDPDRVVAIATAVSTRVVERFDQAFVHVPARERDALRTIVTAANRNMPTPSHPRPR